MLVIERGDRIGAETTSRNFGVIHAGLYYPPGTRKARLCVEGRQRLYAFCARFAVAQAGGKYVVVTAESELPKLRAIYETPRRIGYPSLIWMTRSEMGRAEPAVSCVAGLCSPSTGIIGSGALTLAIRGDVEAHRRHARARSQVHRRALDGWFVFCEK